MNTVDPLISKITFIQYDEPALEAGSYQLAITQKVQIDGADVSPGVPDASIMFAVIGERFSFDDSDIDSIFPADLATGEFSKILPHVIFTRRTLPWERSPGGNVGPNTPWLALLLINDEEMIKYKIQLSQRTAKDLIPSTALIKIYDAQGHPQSTVNGTLVPGVLAWNTTDSTFQLDYGESPDTPCTTIDIPLELFNQIAPSLDDLAYLAHAREVDTTHSEDTKEQIIQRSIVIGNRLSKGKTAAASGISHLFLVSLEKMGPYLPREDETSNTQGYDSVRLIVYRNWKFFANNDDQLLENLLENLVPKLKEPGVSALQYYYPNQPTPSSSDILMAVNNELQKNIDDKNAQNLLCNALSQGYIPLPHHTRHGGSTVSWYRGPLLPYATPSLLATPISSPDAANRYNPCTGMFDVSYGAAWQLGQLLALKNSSFATALYNWKKAVTEADVLNEEKALLEEKLLGVDLLKEVLNQRNAKIQSPPIPDEVVNWIAKLRLLEGVPFNYLVPDEQMLPPESMRFFYLDQNWADALVDGAFSIGRTTTGDLGKDKNHLFKIRKQVMQRMSQLRPNPRPSTFKKLADETEIITGVLIRSKAVSGWPRLIINGYEAGASPESECLKYKMVRLAADVLICFFGGDVAKVAIHEPPEQLHFGVEEIEGHPGLFTIDLRVLTPNAYPSYPQPGQALPDIGQILTIETRADGQTIEISNAATAIMNKLNTDYNQGLTSETFTSAEFGIEMVKGVVQVEFSINLGITKRVLAYEHRK